MEKSFLSLYFTGFLRAAKMLLEYPKIEGLWDKFIIPEKGENQEYYTVCGFAVTAFVVGFIGTLLLWLVTALIPDFIGTLVGAIMMFLIIELKDKFSGTVLSCSYLSSRLDGVKHKQSWAMINDNIDVGSDKLYGVCLSFAVLIKFAFCFVLIEKDCEFMLIPILMINYCLQGFLASNRSLNDKIFFHLELHDLEKFCIISMVLFFVGVYFNFVLWLFGLFVFALMCFIIHKNDESLHVFKAGTLTLTGAVGEFILMVLLGLHVI